MPIIQSRSKSKQQRRTVTRVHTAPFRRARAAGRRRSLRGDAGQAALVLVIAITVLLTMVGGVMIANIVNNDPLLTNANIQRYAYRALSSGLNSYTSAINANPYLGACNTNTNGTAQCAGLTYGTWSQVPGTDLGNGVIPEYYKFDNPQSVIDPTTSMLTSLQVQIVGAAGFSGRNVNYSMVAKFVPANVWWTNFESTGTPSTCQYWWATNYNNTGSCTEVNFAASDIINGPAFSNDSIFVTGTPSPKSGPHFGSGSTDYGVTTADPKCQFIDFTPSAYSTPTGNPNCSSAIGEVYYNSAASSYSATNLETIPTDNTSLGNYAQQAGCYYVGPTTVTLVGNKMTVLSPESATDANRLFGGNTNTCPTDGTTSVSLPSNGVIFVDQNPSTNPPITTANPYSSQTYYGKGGTPWTEGDVFVQGSLSGHLTIGANNDVIIDGPITYSDCASHWAGTPHETTCGYIDATSATPNDTLGLIALNYVEIARPMSGGNVAPNCGSIGAPAAPLCDPTSATGSPYGGGSGSWGLTIDASILALQQSFAVNNYDQSGTSGGGSSGGPTKEGHLTIYGSIQQDARGPVGTGDSSGNLLTGFLKDYNFDPRLALYSPPYYLSPGTASWALDSSSQSTNGSCPVAPPVQKTPAPATSAPTWPWPTPVSYTHLTLPTKRIV